MRVAAYARSRVVIHVDGALANSILDQDTQLQSQIDDIRAWADQNGHRVVKVYKDPGVSAYVEDRPVFEQMIRDAEASDHPFDVVAVHDWPRLNRGARQFAPYEARLAKAKVQLISVANPPKDLEERGKLLALIQQVIEQYQKWWAKKRRLHRKE